MLVLLGALLAVAVVVIGALTTATPEPAAASSPTGVLAAQSARLGSAASGPRSAIPLHRALARPVVRPSSHRGVSAPTGPGRAGSSHPVATTPPNPSGPTSSGPGSPGSHSGPSRAPHSATTPPSPVLSLGAQFVTRRGSTLLLGGRPFRYVGLNYYYANDRDNMPNGGYNAGYDNNVMNSDLTELDQSIGANDKVLRIWFFQRQATVNGQRDWAAFDHTLKVAAAHGYKVIAVLTDQYDYTEGPYKDISFYQGGYKSTVWPTSTTDYLDYVKQVVARYRDNPTIMAWQLVNEGKADDDANGDCPSENAAFQALYGFVSTVTTAIHQIDRNHLISNGLLYNNCGTHSGTDHYATLADLPYNDLYELHDYSGPSVALSSDAAYIFSAAAAADRPAIVGEVGLPLSLGLAVRAAAYSAKFAAWWQFPVVAGVTPWVWNGQPQLGTVDRIFDISPGDPTLSVMARFGRQVD